MEHLLPELFFPQAAPRGRSRSLIVLLAAGEAPAGLADSRPGAPAAAARIAELEAEVARLREALAYHRSRAAAPLREHTAGTALMARLREAAGAAEARAPLVESTRRRAAVRSGAQIPGIR